MSISDFEYLQCRAREEREAAASARDHSSRAAHLEMAREYERRAYQPAVRIHAPVLTHEDAM